MRSFNWPGRYVHENGTVFIVSVSSSIRHSPARLTTRNTFTASRSFTEDERRAGKRGRDRQHVIDSSP